MAWLEIDLGNLAAHIPQGAERDGSFMSIYVADELAKQHAMTKESNNRGFILSNAQNQRFKPIMVTRGGVNFGKAVDVGGGRTFNKNNLAAENERFSAYLCADITTFPNIKVHIVPTELVQTLFEAGQLGAKASVGRNAFHERIVPQL